MIELHNNKLSFSFPQVHPKASCQIDFQRTLRIPDDNRAYPLPAGLGKFPMHHVDDYAGRLPDDWITHGGTFIPLYQSEALWINFSGHYPCAVKIAAGKINAVSGERWTDNLSEDPQDYVVVPDQPWLDGFNVSDGFIRQFVAMPMGDGYTAEEQLTGDAEFGGLQVIAYPMKQAVYKELFEKPVPAPMDPMDIPCFLRRCSDGESVSDMGMAPGGLMKQAITDDQYGTSVWDQEHGSRCYIHLVNSVQYKTITGTQPPQHPITSRDYKKANIPWFDYYDEGKTLSGAVKLRNLISVAALHIKKGKGPMEDNEPVQIDTVKTLKKPHAVRDGEF